jgi:tetratricopeptide (TPR) repeat protein
VFRYKGREFDLQRIAQELKVQAILTGRVAQRGDQLTLSLELVDTQTENVIWTEQYNRKQTDLVSLQGEIARDVSSKLKTKLSGADEAKLTKTYTTSPDAYQSYLRGRFFWNKRNEESIRKAIEQFKEAADKDPNYALAFVGLADSYVLLPYYSGGNSNDMAAQAKVYALRALEIDDSLGEAHSSLGYVYRLSWSWAAAEKELKRAIELNPKYATAHKFLGNVLTDLGRTQESLVEYKRAQELEPLSMIINANLAEVYLQQGDANAAVEQCKRAIDLDPNWYYAWQELSLAHIAQGRNAEALAEAEKGVELSKRFSVPLGVLGYVYARTGKRSEAAAVVEELKKRYTESRANGYDLAKAYVGLGETDQAFAWLEKDFQSHNATMPNFLDLAPLDVLRNDPRFSDLARRIGLRTLK